MHLQQRTLGRKAKLLIKFPIYRDFFCFWLNVFEVVGCRFVVYGKGFKWKVVDPNHYSFIQKQICEFMDKKFEKIVSTQRAITLLVKFESLSLPDIPIHEKYQRILSHYGRDIEMVSKIYQKNKNDPPVARDLPPIAGLFTFADFQIFFALSFRTWYDSELSDLKTSEKNFLTSIQLKVQFRYICTFIIQPREEIIITSKGA